MNCLSDLRKISQQVIEEQGWSEKQVRNILDYKKEIKPKNTLTKEEIMEAKADLLYDDNTFLEEYFLGELDEISKDKKTLENLKEK